MTKDEKKLVKKYDRGLFKVGTKHEECVQVEVTARAILMSLPPEKKIKVAMSTTGRPTDILATAIAKKAGVKLERFKDKKGTVKYRGFVETPENVKAILQAAEEVCNTY
jgi:hypothetical protein